MKCIVGVVQMCSKANLKQNIAKAIDMTQQCITKGATFIFLPESFAFIADKNIPQDADFKYAENIEGETISLFRQIAKKNNVWLSLGGFPITNHTPLPYNSHIVINNNGEVASIYNKLHLFNVTLGLNNNHSESKAMTKGDILPAPIQTPLGLLGLSICYDLRFPEIYRRHFANGATALAIPAAFLKKTGEAHWDILMRARAIENQSFVIAAAQVGWHNTTRVSYGHSMIIDPWGTVVGELKDQEGILVEELNLSKVQEVRKGMPCFEHLRKDIFKI